MVDAELLLATWLRTFVGAVPVVVDSLPDDQDLADPAGLIVRLQLLDDTPSTNTPVPWLSRPWFQVDVYGGTKAQANDLSAEIIEALPSLVGAHTDGVVTRATGGRRSLPDVGFRPPRPRYVVSVHLSVHP